MQRRTALKTLAAALITSPAVISRRYRVFGQSSATYSERTIRLVRESPVIDMLCQFAHGHPRPEGGSLIADWMRNPRTFTEEHFAKFRDSGMSVLALGQGTFSKEIATQWNDLIAAHPNWLTRVVDPRDLVRPSGSEKLGIMLTAQDSSHFRSVDDVNAMHGLGQRVSQLTYNQQNRLGAGFFEEADGGLTPFGHQIVQRMQEVGMAIDVSHCGDRTTLDTLAAAKKAILFTHASCRTLVPGHPRCKTDEMIRKLAAGGGVMGILNVAFLIRDAPPVTVGHVVDHIAHVARLVGMQHVGIGSDLDIEGFTAPRPLPGAPLRPPPPQYRGFTDNNGVVLGMKHPRRVFDLTEGLISRGFSDVDIKLVLGGNFVRVLTSLWS